MTEIRVTVECTCRECGNPLTIEDTSKDAFYPADEIIVHPCLICIKEAEEAAYEAAFDKGYDEAKEEFE